MAKKQNNEDQEPENEALDLEKELEQETEEATTEDDFVDVPDFPGAESEEPNDDFEHEMITPDEEEDDSGEYRDDPEYTKDYFHKTAHRWVKAFNALQKSILRKSYKKTILQPGDAEKAKEWQKKKARNPNAKFEDIVDGDWEVQERLDRYMKAVEELPFTNDEAEDIAAPLAELVEKYRHLRMSPEMALVVAVTIAMLPRLEPIFPNVNEWFGKIFGSKGDGK